MSVRQDGTGLNVVVRDPTEASAPIISRLKFVKETEQKRKGETSKQKLRHIRDIKFYRQVKL